MGLITKLENIETRLNALSKIGSNVRTLDEKSLQVYLSELDNISSELKSINSKFLDKTMIKELRLLTKSLFSKFEDELKIEISDID